MTKEEAIRQLRYDRDMCLFDPSTGENEPVSEDCRRSAEALGMAIAALTNASDDCVSRQEAVEALKKVPGTDKRHTEAVMRLRPVTPEPYWTKTEDGTPDEGEKVLVVDRRGVYHVWSVSYIGQGTNAWRDESGYFHYIGDIVKWTKLRPEAPVPEEGGHTHICAGCEKFYRSAWKEPCCSAYHIILMADADEKYCERR